MEVKRNYIKTEDIQTVLVKDDPNLKKAIERILKEDFGIPCEVEIFGYDLRGFGVKKIKIDQMTIIADSKYVDVWHYANFNGRFKEFGIEYGPFFRAKDT